MRTLVLALLIAAPPAFADEGAPRTFLDDLFEEFANRTEDAMRDMIEDIQPEFEEFLNELGPEVEDLMGRIVPELQELADELGGMVLYELPEVLPNGDIIIRRRRTAPPVPEDLPETRPSERSENAPIDL